MKKNNLRFHLLGSLLFLLCLMTQALKAELMIEITQGIDDAVPIAIVPFALEGVKDVPENIAKIIASDLERSGQFKPMPIGDMLSRPSHEKEIFFRDWKIPGIEYLLIGSVKQSESSNQYQVSYELYDVNKGSKITGKKYLPSNKQFRDVAHAMSDTVYEKLTGLKGVFSTKILYITVNREQIRPYQLQYADADGYRAVTVFSSKDPIMSPSWSPDATKVAYVSFENRRPAIFVQNLYTEKREKISSFRGINGAPDWSPDGKKLALTLSRDGNPEIYIMDLETRSLKRVTNHYGIDTEPRWSPDGQALIFTSNRSGGPQIYRKNLVTSKIERLTWEGSYNARGDLTPDGKFLIMVHKKAGVFHIAVQNLDRGTLSIVTETQLDESPSVAPNGSMLLYATYYEGEGVLGAVSIDGRVKFRLPSKEGKVREPAWSPWKK